MREGFEAYSYLTSIDKLRFEAYNICNVNYMSKSNLSIKNEVWIWTFGLSKKNAAAKKKKSMNILETYAAYTGCLAFSGNIC